jgi:hypothetical protein
MKQEKGFHLFRIREKVSVKGKGELILKPDRIPLGRLKMKNAENSIFFRFNSIQSFNQSINQQHCA